MYITILGRQPALGAAELESVYGSDAVRWFSDQSVTVSHDSFSLERLGGVQKAGRVRIELSHGNWRKASLKIVQEYTRQWVGFGGKLTLGISAYGFDASYRDIQKTGIILKQKLKASGVSVRLIPNTEPALSSAASHHNKLGLSDNKKELIVVRARSGKIIIAESVGSQNITAYALRDQKRPKRDAFVGMLPPKLAQIMINLATPTQTKPSDIKHSKTPAARVSADVNSTETRSEAVLEGLDGTTAQSSVAPTLLDPFCGTGVVLQEAALMGYRVYGTDLSDKMIDYTRVNLDWLAESHRIPVDATLHQGDAMETTWQQPISVVACESYLGQPFSAPPSPAKLAEVTKNCDHIISSFLKNIAPQLAPGTPLCVAVPAWRAKDGTFTHLPLIGKLEKLGLVRREFSAVKNDDLLYYREDQVVARELLVMHKS